MLHILKFNTFNYFQPTAKYIILCCYMFRPQIAAIFSTLQCFRIHAVRYATCRPYILWYHSTIN